MKKDCFSLNLATADNLGMGLFKYSLRPSREFIFGNAALARMLDYRSVSELKKQPLDSLFLSLRDRETFFKAISKKGKIRFFETVLRGKKNKGVWVAITCCRIVSDGRKKGKEEYLEGVIEDISGHKELEEKLSLEKDLLQGLLDNIPDAIYFKDRKNRIIKVNKFYIKGTGLKQEEILGKTDYDFFPADQAEKMFADDNSVLNTGKPIVGKIERTLLPNGTWNQVITTKIPMYDKAGVIVGTMGITRDMTNYANLERERLEMLQNALDVLVKTLEMRDPYTVNHSRHVAGICERIGHLLGWDENRLLSLRLAGELHDLGKMSIPLDILNKSGKLSDLEYRLVQEHVAKCYDLIKDIDFPFSLAEIIYQHHERMDGTGYPRQLSGDQILPEARILAVGDVLESMTHHRPYRNALGIEKAVQELQDGRGSKYDSDIVQAAIDLVKEGNGQILQQISETGG